MGSRFMETLASVLGVNVRHSGWERPRHTSMAMQNCIDMAVTLPQYLVLKGEPILKIGLHRQWAERPTEDTLQGKSSTEEITSWQPRKRPRRRKRNTNRRRDVTSHGPKRIFTRSLPGEAPPGRLFDSVVDHWSRGWKWHRRPTLKHLRRISDQ